MRTGVTVIADGHPRMIDGSIQEHRAFVMGAIWQDDRVFGVRIGKRTLRKWGHDAPPLVSVLIGTKIKITKSSVPPLDWDTIIWGAVKEKAPAFTAEAFFISNR
jgi:hypothetical protein